jgi:hypothetical protein
MARKRLYHPDPAPINAPNPSDWKNRAPADRMRSDVVAPPVVPLPFPLGLEAGEPAAGG